MSFTPESFTLKSCGSDIAFLIQFDDNFQSLFTQKMQQLNTTAGSACQSDCGTNLLDTTNLQDCGQCLQGTSTPVVAKNKLVGCSTCYDFIAPLAYYLSGSDIKKVTLPSPGQITTFLNNSTKVLDTWKTVDPVNRLQVWEQVCGKNTFSYNIVAPGTLSPATPITPISSLSPATPITPISSLSPAIPVPSESSDMLSTAAIVGIVVGSIVALLIMVALLSRRELRTVDIGTVHEDHRSIVRTFEHNNT